MFDTILMLLYERLHLDAKAVLPIFIAVGQKAAKLVKAFQKAGYYHSILDEKDKTRWVLYSRVYFYGLETNDFVRTHKMVCKKNGSVALPKEKGGRF